MQTPATPRALEGSDLETWASLATVLEWLPPALDEPLEKAFELTHFEYGILYALAGAEDQRLRIGVLAGYAHSSISRLSRAVTRLESRGWVARSRDPFDGRSIVVTLTDDGRAVFARATPTHEENVHRLVLDALTAAQRRQLLEITRRIQRSLLDDGAWRPPASRG